VGRLGPLLLFAAGKDYIVAKIDPLTGILQRNAKGFCVLVKYLFEANVSVVQENGANF
jgi:hypothetical protein